MTRITVTYDGASRHRVYLNDALSAERLTQVGGNEGANSEPAWVLTLGRTYNGFPNGFFTGDMSEFAFFQRELTGTEVQQLTASGPAGL